MSGLMHGPYHMRLFVLTEAGAASLSPKPGGAAVVTAGASLADSEAARERTRTAHPATAASPGLPCCLHCGGVIRTDPVLAAVDPRRACSLRCAELLEAAS